MSPSHSTCNCSDDAGQETADSTKFVDEPLPSVAADIAFGLLAPVGTPDAIVDILHRATHEALQRPEIQARLTGEGATAPAISRKQFGELIEDHSRSWSQIIAPLGLQLD